jgi:hypothetical protein
MAGKHPQDCVDKTTATTSRSVDGAALPSARNLARGRPLDVYVRWTGLLHVFMLMHAHARRASKQGPIPVIEGIHQWSTVQLPR